MPPQCFFPKSLRTNLWTVPSCKKHNLDLSNDVEYVRSIIALDVHTNGLARELVRGKIRRSWTYSPSLLRRTFAKVRELVYRGEQTGILTVEVDRLERVIGLVASALYFRDTSNVCPHNWYVYGGTMVADNFDSLVEDPNNKLKAMFGAVQFREQTVPVPEVFQSHCFIDPNELRMYKMVFYEGAVLYAVPLSDEMVAALAAT